MTPPRDAAAEARALRERWRRAAEAGWDETLTAADLLALLDGYDAAEASLEAARAVVEAARVLTQGDDEDGTPPLAWHNLDVALAAYDSAAVQR